MRVVSDFFMTTALANGVPHGYCQLVVRKRLANWNFQPFSLVAS